MEREINFRDLKANAQNVLGLENPAIYSCPHCARMDATTPSQSIE